MQRTMKGRPALILVTGATGNVGREVVKLLLDEGKQVVAVTRDPAAAVLPRAAHLAGGDPSRPETLTSALARVEAVFLNPATLGNAIYELLSLAAERGVQRVVLISAVTVEYGGGYRRFAERFKAAEDAVKASGLQWTFLRSAQYATNALAWVPQIRSTGVVRGAYGNAGFSPIHPRDVAAVGVRALVNSAHAGRSYPLTGPQSLTQPDQVRLIGEAIGTELSFEEISPEQVRQTMIAQGLPEDVPDRMLGYLAECARQPGPSTTAVEQVLGRPAVTFAEWAAENASAFRS